MRITIYSLNFSSDSFQSNSKSFIVIHNVHPVWIFSNARHRLWGISEHIAILTDFNRRKAFSPVASVSLEREGRRLTRFINHYDLSQSSFDRNNQYLLQFSISMTRSIPRIIVIGGLIQWVSTIGRSYFFVNKLWFPSSIKLISSQSVDKNKSIKSVVIENMSKLKRMKSEAFLTRLCFWVRNVFRSGNHFPQLHLNQGRDCQELNSKHSFKLFGWNHSSFIDWSLGW
jgi:hypothetical protein